MENSFADVASVTKRHQPLLYSAKTFQVFILGIAVFLPLIAIGYLRAFGDADLLFKSALIHEIAIALAIILAGFITLVAFENYRSSGDPFLRYITLGFLGFTLIYAPHGLLTRMADHDVVAFLIFGPVSRLTAALYFLIAFFRIRDKADEMEHRHKKRLWWPHILLFLVIDVALVAASAWLDLTIFHIRIFEVASLVLFLSGVILAFLFRPLTPLVWFHICALLLFIQASIAFLLSKPWIHMWWLAHATSAAGFILLGYALMQAFQTTRSFKNVYSAAQLYEHLVGRTQALEMSNQQLQLEIAERKQAEEEIRNLNKKLEQHSAELSTINQELEAFSYSVSHDLRTPLRAIDGFSAALLKKYGNRFEDEGLQYLKRVRAATAHMNQLIDDLLKLALVSRSNLRAVPTNLSSIAREIADELAKREPQRQVEFMIAPEIWVNGDAQLLRIALDNLFENAWKFTSKREHARIEFGKIPPSGEAHLYFIRDNGAGFDMAYSAKLFNTFQRLHDARDYPGTGIGLTTVQRVMQKHGGRIWAEAAVDQGACFYFTLVQYYP